MCGIVGYAGFRDCSDVLVDSLSKLEYRGYDSAGIAVFEQGAIKVCKAQGKLEKLKEKMEIEGKPHGCVGIGHTRWATHGEPSDVNSHPHSGARVTVVHNGIIENYRELKEFLVNRGVEFLSETDTEVVAQLLNYYYDGSPLDTIIKTIGELDGSFALGIVFADYPEYIYAVRRESPLIVGVGEGENYIASDVPAILKYTKDYYLLDHDEIAELSKDEIKIYDEHKELVEKQLMTADWDESAAEKGGYEHFMIKEINEQPNSINMTVKPRVENELPNLFECGITHDNIKNFRNIFVVACGTAMHAGLVGKYVIEKLARVPVTVDIASEFRYRNPIVGEGDLVIIISQSGETADSLAAMRLAKSLGAKTLAIVNAKGSSIAREADMLIYTHAGPEIAVASTKAYIVQLSVMYLFAFELALAKGKIDEDECKKLTSALLGTPELMEKILATDLEKAQYISTQLIAADSLLYIGRGFDYALSMEGSLKLKEISYIHSESYAAGELKHGTISLITDGMPVIAVATQSDLLEKTVSNIVEVKSRGAKVILITREDFKIDEKAYDFRIDVPVTNDMLMPMLAAVPMQLIAYYTAVLRGNDVDKPRNLAKSVTVE
ncbi:MULTISPECIES: glutamine--fructose-6-phosphate transaminase (isomerizing) [unclassified Ruminococcus]|uniref:glutamine--fructose-6-phosphate transaminase (isomerizing) n=1 Tax=unclassified Ruminococcus TaxID=2608920 RepID=UPI00210DD33F|nr:MULTISPECIES: glutamine--fructose-6-phosphate transaminase (isomerizing) [unclassified Ruminococcus]MCQ4022224.1 glutamine--fructose-6-phosphate transaminase (isomerizing) [Ruminococcus sp. zg-924]MCQ4115213.1 glutamine--fructose-6-phosphate transaminase (isomerizing) [Ruminococcus sp. zg-921]